MTKSHDIGALDDGLVDQRVTLCGWVTSIRCIQSHLIFMTLQDAQSAVQVILEKNHIEPSCQAQWLELEKGQMPLESVLSLEGIVKRRPNSQVNSALKTGSIEIQMKKWTLLNRAQANLAFPTFSSASLPLPSEDIRLQYRYLDLRRASLHTILCHRAKLTLSIRQFLSEQGFIEVETPLLFKSTPEGAREFLVATRQPRAFYALPQSPQQFKQLLMVSGFPKYFQMAKCFRDEDGRSDRQPEFTQIDIEMAFVTRQAVLSTMEALIKHIWALALPHVNFSFNAPSFPILTYSQAMARYGSDKPDLRYGMSIQTLHSEDDKVEAMAAISEAFQFPFQAWQRDYQIQFDSHEKGVWQSMIEAFCSAFLSEHDSHFSWQLLQSNEPTKDKHPFMERAFLGLQSGDWTLVVRRKAICHEGYTLLGKLRPKIAKLLIEKGACLYDPQKSFCFLWVIDFPLFAPKGERWIAMHHPFTAPLYEDLGLLETQPLQVRGQHYDLVLNGVELGGGSIRIHERAFQEYIMRDIMKMEEKGIQSFAHLLAALHSGCPPHGGMALGFDRLLAMLWQTHSIRDVIAFPKNQSGVDVCVGAPSLLL